MTDMFGIMLAKKNIPPDDPFCRLFAPSSSDKPVLPAGYTARNYIESNVNRQKNWGQVINTGVTDAKTVVELDMILWNISGGSDQFLFGKEYRSYNAYRIGYNPSSDVSFKTGGTVSNTVVGTVLSPEERYTLRITPTKLSWEKHEGGGTGYIENSPSQYSNSTMPYALFNVFVNEYYSGSQQSVPNTGCAIPYMTYSHMRMYSAKFWVNDELVRHFIPCVRAADNKPGLWDAVGNAFYTNAMTSSGNDFLTD